MCCTQLAGNAGHKKSPKIPRLRTITQLCRGISSQLRHVSTIGKKLVKQQSTCPHNMVNYSPQAAEIDWWVWGTPSIFQWVLCLGFNTAEIVLNGSQPNFARCLAISWAATLYIHFRRRLLQTNRILPGAKFTLYPSLAFS